MRKPALVALLALIFPVVPVAATGAANGGEAVFAQLQSLVGTWEGTFANGRQHTVTYRPTANNTALVETWTMSATRESMTIYTLDGDMLLATHYCPQGNAPRLKLTPNREGGKLRFEFRDGMNVQVKDKSHQHAFWIRFLGKDSFERSETYVMNGSNAAEIEQAAQEPPVVYKRIK